jgi:hypothetical protein
MQEMLIEARSDKGETYNFRCLASFENLSVITSVAKEESFILWPFLSKQKVAGRCGSTSQDMSLNGRFRWKDITAASTPLSDCIFCAMTAAALAASGDKQNLIA